MTKQILTAADIKLSQHAIEKMAAEDITVADILAVLNNGETIEDYSNDQRGASYLNFAMIDGRPLHVCASRVYPVVIITTYRVTMDKFEADYKTRRKK